MCDLMHVLAYKMLVSFWICFACRLLFSFFCLKFFLLGPCTIMCDVGRNLDLMLH